MILDYVAAYTLLCISVVKFLSGLLHLIRLSTVTVQITVDISLIDHMLFSLTVGPE